MHKIELSYKVAKEYIRRGPIPFPEHFPFSKFMILIPFGIFFSQQKLENMLPDWLPFHERIKAVEQLKKSHTELHVIAEDEINLNWHDIDKNEVTVSMDINPETNEVKIDIDKNIIKEEKAQIIAYKLINILNYTIDYMNSPIEYKESSNSNNPKNYNNRNYPVNEAIKINRVRYTSDESDREYERHKDAWIVRGHWRRYRDENGKVYKKVWISSYVKGDKEKLNESKNYKIDEE
ncbi:MAG: hypothetical protein ACOCT9_01595 [archaeon]